jgi:hypothetical protein
MRERGRAVGRFGVRIVRICPLRCSQEMDACGDDAGKHGE